MFTKIQDLELSGRRVFVRVDFNVPLRGLADGRYEVTDSARIEGALHTIRYVVQRGGRCILASHLGRPDGRPTKKYSLDPVGVKLSELLNADVILTDDCVGDGAKSVSHQMRNGEICLLENLRFHKGEEENSLEFANKLAELCDVYVNDAFGALHRAHASVSALPKVITQKGVGFLVQRELQFLEPLREKPQRPFALVMGGAKVSDKIGVLEHLLPKLDTVIVGGAMAYAFLKAQGVEIGKSLCQSEQVSLATKVLRLAEARNVNMVLPEDHLVTASLQDPQGVKVTSGKDIPADLMGVDIGPKTIAAFTQALSDAKTIFWNGPMGVFEQPAFANGTFELARVISESTARKLAGGGDSAAAIAKSGCESRFDFISTGGGATLEYLEGKELPGLKALELSSKSS